jgi:ribosomal protein S18 acetylase RimI-like enzyme
MAARREVDPSAITLRPIQDEDEPLLFRVYASTREVERDAWQWEDKAWNAFLRMQFEAQRRHYTTHFPNAVQSVVLRDDEPVGRTWVYRSPEEIRLLDIAILPKHRQRGIGTHLIRQLQEEARQAGVPLRHSVEFGNPGAKRLYERLGFVAVQTHGMHTLMEWDPVGSADHRP